MTDSKKTAGTDLRILSLIGHLAIFMNQFQTANKGQGRVLQMLAENGEMSQKDLQVQSGITRAALSETLSKLESKGLISRRRSEQDARAAIITLTTEGMIQAERDKAGMRPEDLLAILNEEEKQQLMGLLRKVMDSWKEMRGTTGGHTRA